MAGDFFPMQRPVGGIEAPVMRGSDMLDAYIKGAELGTKVPSTGGAIVQGISQGIDNYNKQVNAEQTQALNQAKINQIPVQDEIAQLELEIKKYEVEAAKEAQKFELKNKQEKAKQEYSYLTRKNQMMEALKSTNADVARTALSPDYADILAKEPELKDTVVGMLGSKGMITEEDKMRFGDERRLAVEQARAKSLLSDEAKLFESTSLALKKDGGIEHLKTEAGLNGDLKAIEKLAQMGTMVPSGSYEYDETGKITGVSSDPSITGEKGKFDFITTDGRRLNKAAIAKETSDNFAGHANSGAALGMFKAPHPYKYSAETPSDKPEPKNNTVNRMAAGSSPTPSGSPTVATSPAPTKGNVNIVNQKSKEFYNKYNVSPTPSPMVTPPAQSSAVAPNPGQPQVSEATPSVSPIAYREYLPSLKTYEKVNAKYDIPTVKAKVNSEPLLAGKSPFLKAIVAVESKGNRNAKSPTGVKGLAQVTQATARQYGLDRDKPEENVKAAEIHSNRLLKMYGDNPVLAAAAYNGGEGRINKALELAGSDNWPDVVEALRYMVATSKLSPEKYKEIVEYPNSVMSFYTSFAMDEYGGTDSGSGNGSELTKA